MKKIMIILAVLFMANLACKKTIVEPVCGCSPIHYPGFNLAIKNAKSEDLLNPATNGSYAKAQIQLYQKDANGVIKQISFQVRPPFNYDNLKFPNFVLISDEIIYLANNNSNSSFYLKLGDSAVFELDLVMSSNKNALDRLVIDDKEAVKDNSMISKYPVSIFYLNL